jgi:hypothetical protein
MTDDMLAVAMVGRERVRSVQGWMGSVRAAAAGQVAHGRPFVFLNGRAACLISHNDAMRRDNGVSKRCPIPIFNQP